MDYLLAKVNVGKSEYPPGDGYISHLGKFGKSSTQNVIFWEYVSFLEEIF